MGKRVKASAFLSHRLTSHMVKDDFLNQDFYANVPILLFMHQRSVICKKAVKKVTIVSLPMKNMFS